MEEPFVGQITLFGFSFAPRGWAYCNGATLQIQQFTALYALIGNYYGNTSTTFNLPDLRGRTTISSGFAEGSVINPGQTGGSETFTVPASVLPTHTHAFNAARINPPPTLSPAGSLYTQMPTAGMPPITGLYTKNATTKGVMDSSVVASTGAGQPVDNRQPSLVLNYCIATTGLWPQRQ